MMPLSERLFLSDLEMDLVPKNASFLSFLTPIKKACVYRRFMGVFSVCFLRWAIYRPDSQRGQNGQKMPCYGVIDRARRKSYHEHVQTIRESEVRACRSTR